MKELLYVFELTAIAFMVWQLGAIIKAAHTALEVRKQKNTKEAIEWILTTITSCYKCVGFWTTLIVTQDPLLAAEVALLAYIIITNQTSFE